MIVREMGIRQGCRALATATRAPSTTASATATGFRRGLSATAAQSAEVTTTDSSRPAIFDSARIRAPARKDKNATQADATAADHATKKGTRKALGRVGTSVQRTYEPKDVWVNPPGPKDITLELLMASQAHMGHHTSLWNPANARYIHGIRQNTHIISLEETAAHLRRAARLVEDIAYRAGLILFVGTRRGHTEIVTRAAKMAQGCHLFTKWTPGSITNASVLLRGLPMRMVDHYDRPVKGFYSHIVNARPLVPDLVVCLNPQENYPLLRECALAKIPTISVLDTDTEPSLSTYNIPANDDSLRCVSLIASVLGRAGELGHHRRLADAKIGKVSWDTPKNIFNFMEKKRKAAEEAAEAAALKAGEKRPWARASAKFSKKA